MSAKSYCPVANVWCFWSKVLESNVTLLTGTVICIAFHDKSLSRHLVWSSVIDCHLQMYGLGGWNGFNFCPFLPMDCRNQLGFLLLLVRRRRFAIFHFTQFLPFSLNAELGPRLLKFRQLLADLVDFFFVYTYIHISLACAHRAFQSQCYSCNNFKHGNLKTRKIID